MTIPAECFDPDFQARFEGVKAAFTRNRRKRRARLVETNDYAKMLRRLLTAYARRVADGDVEDLADMLQLARHVDELTREVVARLREDQEFSWADIARATGTTRQAAFQRYGAAS